MGASRSDARARVRRRAGTPVVLAATAVALAGGAWATILRTYFADDDFLHLYELVNLGPRELVLSPFGGHMCMVRNLVMAASFALFGLEPRPYFAIVLATHMANTALVFLVATGIGADAALAFLGAVLFALSPTHVAALDWYSVYGHVLSCFFTLLGLWLLVRRRDDSAELGIGRALAFALVMLAASQAFGTGAGVALAAPVAAAVLRPRAFRRPIVAAMLCAIPIAVILTARFLFLRPSPNNPDPSIQAGLLLSFFWGDVPDVAAMTAYLAALGSTALVLQSAYSPSDHPALTTLIVPTLLGAGFVLAVIRGDAARRRALVALVVALGATCAAIAFGRATMAHLMRPGGVIDAVRSTPRYFYQIQALAAVVLVLLLDAVTRGARALRGGLVAIIATAVVVSYALHPPTIDHYHRQRGLVARARQTITDEVEAHAPGAPVCLSMDGRDDALIVWAAKNVFPGWAAIFMLLYPTDEVSGRRVYFTTTDEVALAARRPGGRIVSLLVPAGQCPPP
jgi:hypothetical protein